MKHLSRDGRCHWLWTSLSVVLLSVATPTASAQSFGAFAPPQQLCADRVDTIHFGFGKQNDVVVNVPHTSLNHAAVSFLPDGTPCSPYGCSYRSALTFNDFANDARIRSANDIEYVRLNMEHSYMADIYINITCPNGQKAVLMRFGGDATSNCHDAIPSSAHEWLDGNNVAEDTFLGQAYDDEDDSEPCNARSSSNRPGVGWNYCWSSNTTSGYRYASGDGIIYRSGHAHGGRLDSSHVASHSNFYHPDQSFSTLTGCPLNGTWYIEVVDGYKHDNGYIFDWELSLAPDLLPTTCRYASHSIDHEWANRLNDTTFTILVPPTLQRDTTIDLRFIITTTCGDTIEQHTQATVSLPRTTQLLDTVVENQLPVRAFRRLLFYSDTDTTLHYTSSGGCDSSVNYQLKVWRNVVQQFDTSVCSGFSSILWRGQHFSRTTDTTLHLATSHLADSTVRLIFSVFPSYDMSIDTGICEGDYFLLGTERITTAGQYTAHLTTAAGCDSLVGLRIWLYPNYADTLPDTTCRSTGTYFEGTFYNTRGLHPHHLLTSHGCDSLRCLSLTVWGENLRAAAFISPQTATLEEPILHFANQSTEAQSVWWQVGTLTTMKEQFEVPFPEGENSLDVMLVATDSNGCTDTFSTIVYVDRSTLYTPNAFTPSLDQNNRWAPVANDMTSIEVWVYDRMGALVYHHAGADIAWDGTSHGQSCPQGIYTYRVEYSRRLYPNEKKAAIGTITLLK
ncbi:MAG: gliding motility-associated C-terminal domain-containing protein [Bacteroidales bacterium]|nr:gliding motility-associated C-terminal domain-containing protein [Bacteroidales bacterium]